ncbi:peroxidase family protein [Nocardioides sp. B-3]|uniref:peroxidase family protein n=1 Tax=Nocardioides sp. B-3 TaxID=2895565 RepID=UPI00300E1D96
MDAWEPDDDVYWGPETTWLGDERYTGERDLEKPLAAVQMGLIYVNPEGPNGHPDPVAAAVDIRETFARMAMNDEETVALIVGGHTFWQDARRSRPRGQRGPGARGRAVRGQRPRLAEQVRHRQGWRHHHLRHRGDRTDTPTQWDNRFLEILFEHEWELVASPAGANQWAPKNGGGAGTVPDAHDPSKSHQPMMCTTDLSLRMDPAYEQISRRFPGEPRPAGRRLRPRVVQADPPRHGPDRALRRPRGPDRGAALAGPGPVCPGPARRGGRGREAGDRRLRALGLAAGPGRVGLRRFVPRLRQAGWRQRWPHPPGAAAQLDGQRPGPSSPR